MSATGRITPPDGSLVRGRVVRWGPYAVRIHQRTLKVAAIVAAVLLLVLIGSLITGSNVLSWDDLRALFTGDARPSLQRSVFGRRLPRALSAALVGALLGMSGAAFQSVSRNPLGSPDIIGFTSGAATAAVAQIVLFGGGLVATAVAAVIGGLFTALLVYLLARRDGSSGGLRLVLVGIGVGAVVSAITALLIARADITDALVAQLWTSGSLTGRGWPHVWALAAAAALLTPVLLTLGRPLALSEMGDESAAAIGVPVERVRFVTVIVAVTAAAAATAAAGPIAFIAFAAGQISRRLVAVPGALIGLSALVGATLLAAADLLSQNLDVGLRTPVGLVTSVLGGLYLLWLLARRI